MNRAREGLAVAVLVVVLAIGLRILLFISVIELEITNLNDNLNAATGQIQQTLVSTQSVLSSLRATTETVRASSVHQMGYYEAIGRRATQTLGEATLLLHRTDARMERLTRSAEQLIQESEIGLNTLNEEISRSGAAAREALVASTATISSVHSAVQSKTLPTILNNLAIASEHLATSSVLTEQTIDHVRKILAPSQKGFWRRLLEAFIPRPSIPVSDPSNAD